MTKIETKVLAFGDDLENPFAMLKDWQRETLKDDVEALARDWLRLRLKGPGPVTELRRKKTQLDQVLAQEQPEFRLECLHAFAQTLGSVEDAEATLSKKDLQDRTRFIDRIPKNDPDLTRLAKRGIIGLTYGACFLFKVLTDFEADRSRVNRAIDYLIDGSSNNGLVVDGEINTTTLLQAYSCWLAEEHQPK